MKRFFFTFGTSDKFPYKGGWVEVFAPDRGMSVETYRAKFPDYNEGIVNCSSIYTEEQFLATGMMNGNRGASCHEILFYKPSSCEEVQHVRVSAGA